MRRRGVTLLEALVALAATALVLSALWDAVARTAVARERATARAEQMAAARAALLRVAGELAAALPAEGAAAPERFVVTEPARGGPPWTALRFATGADDPRLVTYRVEPGPGGGVLTRRSISRFAPPAAAEPSGLVLVAGVRAFSVRCSDGLGWTTAWTGAGLPRAVEIGLALAEGAPLTTTVTLPSGGGA